LAHLPNGAVFRLGFGLLALERDNGFVAFGFVVDFGALFLVLLLVGLVRFQLFG
jgi:hypothetical protein